jgi:hypothetical protein
MNKTKAHCNKCLGERNHEILHSYRNPWDNSDYGIYGEEHYEFLKCCGCEGVTLRHTNWFSEHLDENGNPVPTIYYYPPAIFRPYPSWFNKLYSTRDTVYLKDLLQEIYIGLQNNTQRIATMGIRALLEFIMIQKVGDKGSFSKNLDEFQSKGHISHIQKNVLSTVLEAGHATMHRSYSPSQEDLSTCMDIAESVIQTIYILPRKADELTKKIPKRK